MHSSDDSDGAGGTYFVAAAHGGGSKEHAEGTAGRPVSEVSELDDLLSIFFSGGDGNAEVDFVTPRAGGRLDGQDIPYLGSRVGVVQHGADRYLTCGDLDFALAHEA